MTHGTLGERDARGARVLVWLALASLGAASTAACAVCPPDIGPGEVASTAPNQFISVACSIAPTGGLQIGGAATVGATGSLDLGGLLLVSGSLRNNGLISTRTGSDLDVSTVMFNQAGGSVLVNGLLRNGGRIDNQAGALFAIDAGAQVQAAGALFDNRGTLRFGGNTALGDARYGQLNSYAGSTLENRGRMTLAVSQYATASNFVNGPGGQFSVAVGQLFDVGTASFTNQAGGDVRVNGQLGFSRSTLANAGQFTLQLSTFILTQAGTILNQAGGTMTMDLNSPLRAIDLLDNAAGATLTSVLELVSAGEARNAGNLHLGGGLSAASFVQSAGSSWLSSGTIRGGSLRFDGGTLRGSGGVEEQAGDRRIDFAAGAALAPSAPEFDPAPSPIGLLSLRSDFACHGCALLLDLAGLDAARHDRVQVTGLAVLEAGTRLGLSFIEGYAPRAGDRIELLSTTQGLTMQAPPTVTIDGLQAGFRYILINDNGVLSLVALNDALPVPEPASAWMVGAGLLVLVGRRLRAARTPAASAHFGGA